MPTLTLAKGTALMKPIWIVDDDQSIRFVLEKALQRENLPTRSFTNAQDVLKALNEGPDAEGPQILVSDIRMPGGSGLDLLEKVKEKLPGLPVIIMTAFSDLDSAVSAFQGGAFEYLPKPFDLPKAVELINRAVEESRREEVVEERMVAAPEMLGQAPAMQDVFRAIGRLSQSQVTVLITGESGSGKELVARALHKHSPRANGPFVAINTAAIPKDLLESELFGHERGAFTGAQAMRRGRFEQADGGTLFLDEIGDMPLALQTRLLRVLQDRSVTPVGAGQAVPVDFCLISATHCQLLQAAEQGRFRHDLYYRLNGLTVQLPALRERSDFVALTTHLLAELAAEQGLPHPVHLAPALLQRLAAHPWPGNLRQYASVLRTACAMLAEGEDQLGWEHLGDDIVKALQAVAAPVSAAEAPQAPYPPLQRHVHGHAPALLSLQQLSSAAIDQALQSARGNVSQAARQLGISRQTLYRKLAARVH